MDECGGKQHEGLIGKVMLKMLNTEVGRVEDLQFERVKREVEKAKAMQIIMSPVKQEQKKPMMTITGASGKIMVKNQSQNQAKSSREIVQRMNQTIDMKIEKESTRSNPYRINQILKSRS